jgi:nitrite reductase/ring-hydroxylating ferredoxin subunit
VIPLGSELRIVRDICPHMGAPLSEGAFDPASCELRCPWHGYAFDARTGELARNPNDESFAPLKGLYAAYRPEKTPRHRLAALAYVVRGGKAYVRRGGER